MSTDTGDIERRYAVLIEKFTDGDLSYENFIESVNNLRLKDENGIYWQIRADDGKWLQWDGSTWVPGIPPGTQPAGGEIQPVPKSTLTGVANTKQPEPGLATTRFLKILGKGMATGFVRHIPLMIGTMVLVWLIHTALLFFVKQGAVKGDLHPLIASILILPGHEAEGLLFWGLLVGLSISIASRIRSGRLDDSVKKIRGTPDFIISSLGAAGFYSVFLVFIGFFGALFIAGLLSNILISIQLSLFFFVTLIAQRESVFAGFLRVLGDDISKTLHSGQYTEDKGIAWAIAGMTGAFTGFIFSALLPVTSVVVQSGIVCMVIAVIFIVVVWMTGKEV